MGFYCGWDWINFSIKQSEYLSVGHGIIERNIKIRSYRNQINLSIQIFTSKDSFGRIGINSLCRCDDLDSIFVYTPGSFPDIGDIFCYEWVPAESGLGGISYNIFIIRDTLILGVFATWKQCTPDLIRILDMDF